ncbi:MAG: class I SAM-dependent methyltransferase [Planctomycetota bacterium]
MSQPLPQHGESRAGEHVRPGGPVLSSKPGMVDFDKYRTFGPYHWKYVETMPDYRARVDVVLRYAPTGGRCLDLGCGDGTYIYYVAEQAQHVVGVDGDPDGIRCAGEQLHKREVHNCQLIEATFQELPKHLDPKRHRFDYIYCMDCIEHVLDPKEVLQVMDRYLARGGRILIGTPLFVGEEHVSPYHTTEFTKAELDGILGRDYEKLGEHLLPAPVPGTDELRDRFYVYYGRRRPWWRRWLRRWLRRQRP